MSHERTRSRKSKVSEHAIPLRCCCGSLLARLVEEGVEFKCRRCKQHMIIPLTSMRGASNGSSEFVSSYSDSSS
jgi:hypothetical protein